MRPSLRILIPHLAALAASVACEPEPNSNCGKNAPDRDPDTALTSAAVCELIGRQRELLGRRPVSTDAGLTYGSDLYEAKEALCAELCPHSLRSWGDNCDFPIELLQNSTVSSDGKLHCPKADPFTVVCGPTYDCTGRHTSGIERASLSRQGSLGAHFAASAHAEAVSVLAFRRMADELRAFDAPDMLVCACEHAADEEQDHTRRMASLANAYGAIVALPENVSFAKRSLFSFALENAVEGCARETYGAAIGTLQAERATSDDLRATLRSIAHDECGHADLSWRIHEWAQSQLTSAENIGIDAALREALRNIKRSANSATPWCADRLLGVVSREERARLVDLLCEHVLSTEAA